MSDDNDDARGPANPYLPEVGAGEYGLPYLPPLPPVDRGPPAEMRSANEFPLSDWAAERAGSPAVGKGVDTMAKLGRATGHTIGSLVGAPMLTYGVNKVDRLSDDVAKILEGAEGPISAAHAQEIPEQLRGLYDQQKMLMQQKTDAFQRREANRPRGRAPDPDKDKKFYDADRDFNMFSQGLTDLNKTIEKQSGSLSNLAETQRKKNEASAIAGKEQTAKDIMTASDRDVPYWEQILRNESTPIGYGVGMGVGHVIRSGFPQVIQSILRRLGLEPGTGVVGRYNAGRQEAADAADALMAGQNRRDWPARVGAVNDFWSRGQPGRQPEVPFSARLGQRPPFEANTDAPPAADLYRATRGQKAGNFGKDLAIAGGGLGERELANHYLVDPAQHRLDKADADFKQNPNVSTAQEVQDARSALAHAQILANLGGGTALGYGISSLIHGRDYGIRPNTNAAEAEQMRINDWLNRQLPRPRGPGGGGGGPPALGGPPGGPQVPLPGPAGGGTPQNPPAGGGNLPIQQVPPPRGAPGNPIPLQGKTISASRKSGASRSKTQANKPETESDALKIYDPNDPSKLTRGQAHGGRVARSTGGGVVHAGPITQRNDGGRTDTVPLDVRSGAYVVPADIVSGLGQGDTGKGYQVLTHMFGPHSPGVAPPGAKTVPIMAAGGEFVISPEAVARVGRGDLKAGHDALDAWVRVERRKTIQQLKKLPGPARD
jgi:hypothetical protein